LHITFLHNITLQWWYDGLFNSPRLELTVISQTVVKSL
jgi:hypothetical protein